MHKLSRDNFDVASLRLRPIFMTTGAIVLGAVLAPIVTSAGAAANHQFGRVIVGGMGFDTIFKLFVVPIVYLLLSGKHEAIEVTERAEIARPGSPAEGVPKAWLPRRSAAAAKSRSRQAGISSGSGGRGHPH